jgi:AraC-like DNA-binding protein
MFSHAEKPFTIDGIKSWLQCINECADVSTENSGVSYHYHDYIEILYALEAGATVWINGEGFPFLPGDLAVINSEVPHTVTCRKGANYICIKFLPNVLYPDQQSVFEFKYALPFLFDHSHQKLYHAAEIAHADIHALLLECMREWEGKETGFELVIRANILKILAGLLRHWREQGAPLPVSQPTAAVKHAVSYINEHYRTANEREVAHACGISYNHFSAAFKRQMGCSFNAYVTALKMREAERLLISTEASITEIASSLGFSTTSHFIARFKEAKHVTPAQFRKAILPPK